MSEYPKEHYIELDNNPYLMGRIAINHIKEEFIAEVDIVHKESHKIYRHIGILYSGHSAEEALISGVQRLRRFFEEVEKLQAEQDENLKNTKYH
ncbi:MAG: hypothetical protein ACOVP4_08975 [Bacteriovoracaceae bacterium]